MRSLSQARRNRPEQTKAVQFQDLSTRPLVEAIFELRWSLIGEPHGTVVRDPGFDFLPGRFFDRVRAEYPELVQLPVVRVPVERSPFIVRHQFRAGPGAWPLIQIGPGILTVNETSGYAWNSFEPRISRALAALFDAYPGEQAPLRPSQAALCYINAISLDGIRMPLVRFLREQLHTSLSVDPALFEDPEQAESAAGLSFSMTFPLPAQQALGTVSISTGQRAGRPSLLWQLETRTSGAPMPAGRQQIESWTHSAHEVLARWFATLSRGELAQTFSRSQ